MAIQAVSFFQPTSLRSGSTAGKHPYETALAPTFILEDIYLRGGFRCLPSLAIRDKIPLTACKVGMVVYTPESGGKLWQLVSIVAKVLEWQELTLGDGSGGGGTLVGIDPISVTPNSEIVIDPDRILPKIIDNINARDDIVALDPDLKPIWRPLSGSGLIGVRISVQHTTQVLDILSNASEDFKLEMGSLVCVIELSVDTPDVAVKAFSTELADERNPYLFISTETMLADEGMTEQVDGTLNLKRKYTLLANREDPVNKNIYWRITYLGDTDASKDSNGAVIRYRQPTLYLTYVAFG